MLVDTHAHLNFPDFQKDLDKVIQQSVDTGVKKIICVSSNVKDSEKAIDIAKKYPGTVFASIGIHPHNTSPKSPKSRPDYHDSNHGSDTKNKMAVLAKLAQKPEVVAIGECGLDFSPAPPGEKDRSPKEQIKLFKKQLEIALKFKKPVIVHTRKAFHETITILEQYSIPKLSGVIHCYSAGKKGIEKVNKLGFYFGVDGNLTYDEGLQNVFTQIPLEKILLETDCPELAPVPYRGQRSEPAHVKIIAEFLAKLKGIQLNKVAQITTQNAKKLLKFNI